MIYRLMVLVFVFISSDLYADDQADLAKKLNNPVAALISVPVEYIVDEKIGGSRNGELTQYKFSPVLPFELNDEWNIISRTIFAQVDLKNIPGTGQSDSGFSDIAESIFFSPKAPTENGWIWGVGGTFLLDTASENTMGAGKWGLGPTAVALKQQGGWTFGALTHYLVDVAGDDNRADIEQFFLQPFASYTIDATKTTFTLQSEATRDLEANETQAVAIFQIGQMFKIGSQIMQLRIGVRNWVESYPLGPDGSTVTAKLTFLFPK